jgi:hypothetical protein
MKKLLSRFLLLGVLSGCLGMVMSENALAIPKCKPVCVNPTTACNTVYDPSGRRCDLTADCFQAVFCGPPQYPD